MKKTTILAAVALITPVFAGDVMVPGSDTNVAVSGSENQSLGRKVLSTPGRLLHVGNDLPPMLSEGTQEFSIGGSLDFSDDFAYNLDVKYGWFVKDMWEFGFVADVTGVESDANFGVGLFTQYNFGRSGSKWVPFVGLEVKWSELKEENFDGESVVLGLDFGIKYFIRENIAVSFSGGAEFAFDDVFSGEDNFQERVKIGTSFYF